MRRALIIVLSVLTASAGIFVAAFFVSAHLCANHFPSKADDLEWLRREFRLSDVEIQKVRRLHESYLPQCREMCERIAAKKTALKAALAAGNGVTPDAETKLGEVAALRAQCQAQMLRHFHQVSQAMPAAQGRRYLAEMQRLTLGFHEQYEQSMSDDPASPHGRR
jgi:hypothetical protein